MTDLQTFALALGITGGMVLIAMPLSIWLSNSKNKYAHHIFFSIFVLAIINLFFNISVGDLIAILIFLCIILLYHKKYVRRLLFKKKVLEGILAKLQAT